MWGDHIVARCVGVKDMRDLVDYNLWNLFFLLLNDSNTMSVFVPSEVRGCIIHFNNGSLKTGGEPPRAY